MLLLRQIVIRSDTSGVSPFIDGRSLIIAITIAITQSALVRTPSRRATLLEKRIGYIGVLGHRKRTRLMRARKIGRTKMTKKETHFVTEPGKATVVMTDHIAVMSRADWLLSMVPAFLGAPMPETKYAERSSSPIFLRLRTGPFGARSAIAISIRLTVRRELHGHLPHARQLVAGRELPAGNEVLQLPHQLPVNRFVDPVVTVKMLVEEARTKFGASNSHRHSLSQALQSYPEFPYFTRTP